MVPSKSCSQNYRPSADHLITVFDLPHELLVTLHLRDSSILQPSAGRQEETEHNAAREDELQASAADAKTATSCLTCGTSFPDVQEQRRHVKSDWHGYNLKQKLRGGSSVTEGEFEKLIDDLDESISGSGSDSEESENEEDRKESTLKALLKKQAKLNHAGDDQVEFTPKKRKRGWGKPPLMWFSTPLLPSNTSLGIYRALFTEPEQQDESNLVEVVRKKQLRPVPSRPPPNPSGGVPLPSTMTSPQIFLCMVGGGHFAGMIVSLAPKMGMASGVEQRQAAVIAHKTFHRYTTRRKQGGSQSSNDSAKGAAHSAGASIRRYNEAALEDEIRALLKEWKDLIDKSQLIFVRATGSANRRTLFGAYAGQVLRQTDPRNRGFPFSTRRATQAELMRAFVELTRVKINEVDEAALAAAKATEQEREAASSRSKSATVPSKFAAPKPSKEEEALLLHTSQLQALVRRSRAPAVLTYLSSNSLPPNFEFHPPEAHAHHHASTPLHLAASVNSPAVVLALISKAGANPAFPNGEGKPPFDLAGERATRDAFRIARSELGEDRWDWSSAHCPPPLSKAEADKRGERERADAEKAEAERRKVETERLKREAELNGDTSQGKKGSGRALGALEKTGAEKREEEARGLTPETRMRLERERRARAAEERMRRMAGGGR